MLHGLKMAEPGKRLLTIYQKLNDHFGDLKWWPGETPFEIAVGAILTQNTNWKNAEIAIARLKAFNILTPESLFHAKDETVATLIRPSGYYNIKTRRLKSFLAFLQDEYNESMEGMFKEETWLLRKKLLGVNGIGEETADSILLYGGNKEIFVVDAYTRRIMGRKKIIEDGWNYGKIQRLFMDNLPKDVELYNQYHALLVNAGKHYCKTKPDCRHCPLRSLESNEIV